MWFFMILILTLLLWYMGAFKCETYHVLPPNITKDIDEESRHKEQLD